MNPEGADTTYHFQYGTSTAYGESIPTPKGTPDRNEHHRVQAHPQDLKPHTVYHYRVLVTNAVETVTGPDQTFTTQPAGEELTLPDGRQWEMVSPPVKDGADINVPDVEAGLVEAAENGGAVSYWASAPTEANAPGNPHGTQVLSARVAGGWSSRDISVPQIEATGVGGVSGREYLFFSSDLSRAIVEPLAQNVLLPPATSEPAVHSTVYIRDNVGGGGYTPLITAADVLPGTEKYGASAGFAGATPDLSHVVLSSVYPLTSPSPVFAMVGEESAIYEWAGGSLQIVSVLPASEGGGPVVGELGQGGSLARGALSNDGSRIVWSGGPEGHVYMRDVAKEETVRLDAVQGGSGAISGAYPLVGFMLAATNGSRVFFTSHQLLTADASTGEDDLYECEMIEVAGKLTCKLTDLTVSENAGESGGPLGVLGASEDGSYVYFTAKGVLAHNAPIVVGGQNVYVHHDGTTSFHRRCLAGNARAGIAERPLSGVHIRTESDWVRQPRREQRRTRQGGLSLRRRIRPSGVRILQSDRRAPNRDRDPPGVCHQHPPRVALHVARSL